MFSETLTTAKTWTQSKCSLTGQMVKVVTDCIHTYSHESQQQICSEKKILRQLGHRGNVIQQLYKSRWTTHGGEPLLTRMLSDA